MSSVEWHPASENTPPGSEAVVSISEAEFLSHAPFDYDDSAVVIDADPRRTDPIFASPDDNARRHYTFTGEGDDGYGNWNYKE